MDVVELLLDCGASVNAPFPNSRLDLHGLLKLCIRQKLERISKLVCAILHRKSRQIATDVKHYCL